MKSLLLSMLEVSLGASVVILLMFLIAPLAGRKFSAKWRYWVWMLLAVRLLLPFEVNLPQPQLSIPVPQQLVVEQDFVPKAEMEDDISIPAVPSEPQSGIIVETQTIAPTIESESKTRWTPNGLELLTILWAVGAAGAVIWQSVNYLRWKNEGKVWNRMVEDGTVLNLYYDLCREQGISKFPKLVQNKRVQSPMMMGLLDPVIILPQMEYSEEDYAVVLTHELNHYKRHDLWYKLLILAACCVHWFNPLVWLMLREAGNDLEITCDEAVVKNHSSDDRAFYCEAILRIMCRGKGRYAVLSTGFNGGKKVLQRRFEAVLNDRASKGFVLGAATMALLVFFSSFVSCDVKEAQEQPSDVPVVKEENQAENVEAYMEYAAIPEELRWIGDRMKHLQPTSGQLDYRWENRLEFWEKHARQFFMVGFDMNERISSKDLATFFSVVANTQHFCNYNEWRTIKDGQMIYTIPSDDVWGVLRSHLPEKISLNFEPTEHCEEDSSPIRYYKELDMFLLTGTAAQFDPIVTETLSVVEDGDVITVELASYDVDKYYAEPQEKVLLETYKFSVRVAYDSWFVLEADIVEHGSQSVKKESTATTPVVTQPVMVPEVNRAAPYKQAFRGLDVHSTKDYETLSFYTTDPSAISTLLDALNWENKQPASMKQTLVTDNRESSGHFIRLITNNMEQLYIYEDHDQALYRDKAGNSTYYDVSGDLYERMFGLVKEVKAWKLNPMTDSRAEPFDENYTTLDIHAKGLEKNSYSLTIRTFCEMLIDDLNWEEIAVRDQDVSKSTIEQLDPWEGEFLRISTNTGRHLYIYKNPSYGVYYTGHGIEHYYKLPSGTYDRVMNLLKTYSFYQDADAPLDEFPFQDTFTQVTVSLQDKSVTYAEPEAIALNAHDSFRMMAGIPTGYFKKANPKEELSLDKGKYVLIENHNGQKLAIFNGKSQALYHSPDGKAIYYELGADYYDIAKAVARNVAGLSDWELDKYRVVLSKITYKDDAQVTTTKDLYDAQKEKVYTMISGLKKTAQPANPNTGVDGNIGVKIIDANDNSQKTYTFMPGCDYVFADGSYVCPAGAYEMLNEYFD